MTKSREREVGFEQSLQALEKIVRQLESGDLPLERALELYEEGVALYRRCQVQLEEAEQKVKLLVKERGEIKTIPFELSRAVGNGSDGSNERDQSDQGINSEPSLHSAAGPHGGVQETENKEDYIDDTIPF